MKCHYDILSVPRTAGDDEIKKSYRKLALKYHPDKNLENIDDCTKQFHLIQQAYEVLIDPQERAWYDKHREAILKGGLGKGDYEDKSLDVYQYFNTSCFSGYGDDETGFYAVYRNVFETISAEDLDYRDDKDSESEIPHFGDSQSSYDEVVGLFYAYWESYCTLKSYVWVEEYDTREAPNRQIRRLMEQDNKKLRDKARKERNEEVRALVAFVRKRDKRVQAYKKMLEERAVEIAKRTEDRKKKDREQRLKDLERYEETSWSAMSGLEGDLAKLESTYANQFGEEADMYVENGSDEDGTPEEDMEEYLDDFFCVACNKEFKTDKAFANHERSKKHKENVVFLRTQMEAEEQLMSGANGIEEGEESIEGIDDKLTDEEEDLPKTKLSKKQKKKRRQQQKMMSQTDETTGDTDQVEEEMDKLKLDDGVNIEEPRVPPINNVNGITTQVTSSEAVEISADGSTEQDECSNQQNMPNKSAANDVTNSIPESCNRCHKTFKTRNKLFDHLKETGHSLKLDYVPQTEAVSAKNKKKKKGKR